MRAKFKNYISTDESSFFSPPIKEKKYKYITHSPFFLIRHVYHRLTSSYSLPLDDIFFSNKACVEHLVDFPNTISRDGLVPLLDFMYRHREPEVNTPKILVYRDFLPFIPKAWSEYITPFDYTYKPCWNNPIKAKTDRDQLILSFYPCEKIISFENIKKLIKDIKSNAYKRVLLLRVDGSSYYDDYNKSIELTSKIFELINKHFSGKCEMVFENTFYHTTKYHHCDYVDLNHNGLLWSDAEYTHKIISAGARPVFTKKEKKNPKAMYINQSLSHGLTIYPSIECGEKFEMVANYIDTLPLKENLRIMDCKITTTMLVKFLQNKLEAKRSFLIE